MKEALWKCIPMLATVVLVLGVVGMLCFSGREISVEQIVALIVAAAGVLGLAAPSLRPPWGGSGSGSGGAAGAAGAVVLIAATALLSGCTPAQRCLAERSTVAALGLALSAAEVSLPDDTPDRGKILEIAHSSLALGDHAVAACEHLRDGDEWLEWLPLAVGALKSVLDLLDATGVDLPPLLSESIDELEELASSGG